MQVWLENIETLFLVGTNLRGGGGAFCQRQNIPLAVPLQFVHKEKYVS